MNITIVFGILIMLFMFYVNQQYIKNFNIDAAIYKINKWRRNILNRLWVHFNTDKNTMSKTYTSMTNELYTELLNSNVSKDRFLSSAKKYKNSI